jgi:hypothetical protein
MDIQQAESSAAKDEQEAEEVSTLAAAIRGHLEDAGKWSIQHFSFWPFLNEYPQR